MKIINIGDRYGRLVVLRETTKEERLNKAGRNYWCKCDCGKEIIVYGHNLKTGNTKSCGCLSKETASIKNGIDMPIGATYGDLTILNRAPKKEGKNLVYWTCKCTCGNIIDVPGAYLRNGKVTSCGCKKYPNRINEIGNTYDKLTVLAYSGSQDGGGAKWLCKCECGNIIEVEGDSLRSGHTRSCGCVKSFKELEITNLLIQNHIIFQTQYCFHDLTSNKKGNLRFDFAIFDKETNLFCLIEYQGQQHTDKNNKWYSEDYIYRDKLKKEYCELHSIPLYYLNKNSDLEQFVIKLKKEVQ